MLRTTVQELSQEVDSAIRGAIKDIIASELIDLESYLSLLDASEAEYFEGNNGVVVRFENHRVFARIPIQVPMPYSWDFTKPRLNDHIEVECEGVFEDELKTD